MFRQSRVREKTAEEWSENSASVLGLLDPRRSETKLKSTHASFQSVLGGSSDPAVPHTQAHTHTPPSSFPSRRCADVANELRYLHTDARKNADVVDVPSTYRHQQLAASAQTKDTSESNNVFGCKAKAGLPPCRCVCSFCCLPHHRWGVTASRPEPREEEVNREREARRIRCDNRAEEAG